MKVGVRGGGKAVVGVVGEEYDVEGRDEAFQSTARVLLGYNGTTGIGCNLSEDGENHYHSGQFFEHLPERLPYDLALRINKDGNMPQVQFNDDGEWRDFAPEGGTGLKAGPWFPYFVLCSGDRLTDHRVEQPCKSAAPPPSKKQRLHGGGSSSGGPEMKQAPS
jgi:hypothetical protein